MQCASLFGIRGARATHAHVANPKDSVLAAGCIMNTVRNEHSTNWNPGYLEAPIWTILYYRLARVCNGGNARTQPLQHNTIIQGVRISQLARSLRIAARRSLQVGIVLFLLGLVQFGHLLQSGFGQFFAFMVVSW